MNPIPDTYTIEFSGYSMYPALQPGDCLVIRRVAGERIAPGDLLVQRNGREKTVIHRLVQRMPGKKGVTKGDAVRQADPLKVSLDRPVERVAAIIRGGHLIQLSTRRERFKNRLRACISRLGISGPAIKQQLKETAVCRQAGGWNFTKGRLVEILFRGACPDVQRRHWPGLLAAIESEGLAGLAHQRFEGKQVPAGAGRTLARHFYTNVAGCLAGQRFLARLENVLQGHRIEVIVLKGASLVDRFYRHPGQRPMQDVDLWVRPADRGRLEALLKDLGFEQNRWRRGSFQDRRVMVDLHTHPLHTDRIAGRDGLLTADTSTIWQRSHPWLAGFGRVRRPDDLDNVLLLCLHLLNHAFSRLIWLEDLRRLLTERQPDFWAALIQRAAALGCTRSMLYGLYLLQVLYPLSLFCMPPVVDLKSSLTRLEKGLLLLSISDRPLAVAAPLLQMLAIRGTGRRIGLGVETIFPRRQVLRCEFAAVGPLQRILFIPRRIFTAAGMLWEPVAVLFRIICRLR